MEAVEDQDEHGTPRPASRRRETIPWRLTGWFLLVGWLLLAGSAMSQADPDSDPANDSQAAVTDPASTVASTAVASTRAAGLTLEAIVVEPTDPAPETLCRLRVRIRNDGEQRASLLGFEVRVAGQRLGVYDDDLFVVEVPAGAITEVELFNFWSTETGRPAPAGDRWTIEVGLLEARWVTVAPEGDDQIWNPVGEVPGLPQRLRLDWGGAVPEPSSGQTPVPDGSAKDG